MSDTQKWNNSSAIDLHNIAASSPGRRKVIIREKIYKNFPELRDFSLQIGLAQKTKKLSALITTF